MNRSRDDDGGSLGLLFAVRGTYNQAEDEKRERGGGEPASWVREEKEEKKQ
jgi:hypothetical protein